MTQMPFLLVFRLPVWRRRVIHVVITLGRA